MEQDEGTQSSRDRSAVACGLRGASALGFLAFVAASGLAWSARWFWVGEIATSFAWHLGLAGFAASAALVAVRARKLAAATALLAALHAGPELWLYLPDGRAGADVPTERTAGEFTLASCNVLFDNQRTDDFVAFVAEHDADVLVCLELSRRWLALLDGLSAYPHILVSPARETWDSDTWGTAILSKRPFTATQLWPIPSGRWRPIMEAQFDVGGELVTVRGVHPMRPGRPNRIDRRDEVLRLLADLPWDERGILAGDLNVTSTSPMFDHVTCRTRLRDSRLGYGRQPTYATTRPVAGIEVAIDHVLVGDALHVLDRRIVEIPGSDHRAVLVRLAVTRAR